MSLLATTQTPHFSDCAPLIRSNDRSSQASSASSGQHDDQSSSSAASVSSQSEPRDRCTPAKSGSNNSNGASQAAPTFVPLPPLVPVSFHRIRQDHAPALFNHGFSTLTFDVGRACDALHDASQTLLHASKGFFALPDEEKEAFRTGLGSEEGWSRVEGEKELITLRSRGKTPGVLRGAAERFWVEAVGALGEVMVGVEGSLGLRDGALRELVGSQEGLPVGRAERVATMLRLFRYERFDGEDGAQERVVAEAHRDLGLLSLVIGDKPGLEVWNRASQSWFAIEKSYDKPAASVLVGRQLERLTNGRYVSGDHRVVVYPDNVHTEDERRAKEVDPSEGGNRMGKRYRYSLVLVLRAHSPVAIDTDRLTTEITGVFKEPLRGVTAGELFEGIEGSHFNINTGLTEREEQRRKLREKREKDERCGQDEG